MAITHKAVDYSIKKLRAFKEVHRDKSIEDKQDSIETLASSFELDLDYAISVMSTYYDETGFVIIGILLGLFMAEYEKEH